MAIKLELINANRKGLKGYIVRMRLSKTETEKTLCPWKLSKIDFSGAFLEQNAHVTLISVFIVEITFNSI